MASAGRERFETVGGQALQLFPGLYRPGQVLPAEGPYDADVQQGPGMGRVDLERAIELGQRAVDRARVEIRHAEIGAHLDEVGAQGQRRFEPRRGVVETPRLVIEVAQVDAALHVVGRLAGGGAQGGGAGLVDGQRLRDVRLLPRLRRGRGRGGRRDPRRPVRAGAGSR